jgi:hypothetical protein
VSPNSSTSIFETSARQGETTAVALGWQFIFGALLVLGITTTGCAVTNWIVDPFDRLGRNQLGVYSSSERDAKPQMIQVYRHDGIVIGSSRITYIDPELVHNYALFNAGFSQAMPEEIYDFIRLFGQHEKIVIIGLDFLMFNEREFPLSVGAFAHVHPVEIVDSRSFTFEDAQHLRDYLVSWNVFVSSLRTLVSGAITRREPPFLSLAGNRNAEVALKRDAATTMDYSETIAYWRTNILFDFQYSVKRIDILREMQRFLKERGIPYIVFINPENARVMDLIRSLGLYGLDLKFRSDVAGVFPDLVDLSESKWAATDFYFKRDPGHYLPAAGSAMINEMIEARADLRRSNNGRGPRVSP